MCFFNWFVEADIAEESAIEYAEMMVEKRIPSIKKFAKVIKSKGMEFFDFNEIDVGDIMDLLQKQGFLDDTKKAEEEATKKLEREKYEKEMREMERIKEEMERVENEAKTESNRLEAERKVQEKRNRANATAFLHRQRRLQLC